jgi:LysM repeat protein
VRRELLSLRARLYLRELATKLRVDAFRFYGLAARDLLAVAIVAIPQPARAWNEDQFERRPLFAYPLPRGRDIIVGDLVVYQIQKGDTLLDVARWFGLSSVEISNANNHMDWWAPPVGTKIILPDEHILPDAPRTGIVLSIPEMRLYYYPPPADFPNRKGKIIPAGFKADNRSPQNGTPSRRAGRIHIPGRSRTIRLENPHWKMESARQDQGANLGSPRGYLRGAPRARRLSRACGTGRRSRQPAWALPD